MNSETIIESGLQLVTRLIERTSVENLDSDLFFNKLENTDIIEIRAALSSGVNALLSKFIAKCILPLQHGGLNMDVLFINTDNQFQVSELFKIVHSKICNIGGLNADELVKKLLNNLKIINCYNYHQFFLTVNSLDNILLKNKNVGLLIIDSISAHYWQQRDDLSYNSYIIKILNVIKNITKEFKVLTIYTKQFHFTSKKNTMDWQEGKMSLRYEICLTSKNVISNEFICTIKSKKDKRQLSYEIVGNNIVWKLKNKQDNI